MGVGFLEPGSMFLSPLWMIRGFRIVIIRWIMYAEFLDIQLGEKIFLTYIC